MHFRRKKHSLDPNTIVIIKQIMLGLFIFAGVAMLLITVWYGTRVAPLTISEVMVSGGETINHELVRELVEDELVGEYLGVVPRRFAWLYPKTAIRDAVFSIDRIHTVEVRRDGGTTLYVVFDEYIPKALWCMSVDSADCFFVDVHGYAFAKAPVLSGGSLLRFVEVGQEPKKGEYIADAVVIDAAVELVALLDEKAWSVSHVEVGKGGDIFLRLVGGGELKVDLNLSPIETVENLLTIINSDEFSHLAPGNFQYIDLRFGNKVFVNEEIAAPEMETASGMASSSEEIVEAQDD
jgi:cell division septal protein FtsQ